VNDAVVFVEIPSGSRNKYEYVEGLGGIVLDRRFFQRYKDLEPSKKTEIRGWGNCDEAAEIRVA